MRKLNLVEDTNIKMRKRTRSREGRGFKQRQLSTNMEVMLTCLESSNTLDYGSLRALESNIKDLKRRQKTNLVKAYEPRVRALRERYSQQPQTLTL